MTPETMIDWMQANAGPLLMAHAAVSGFVLAYIVLAAIDRLCGPGRLREEYRNICRAVCTLGLYPLLAWPWRAWRNWRKRERAVRRVWRCRRNSDAFWEWDGTGVYWFNRAGECVKVCADLAHMTGTKHDHIELTAQEIVALDAELKRPHPLAAIAQAHRDCPVEQKPGVRAWRNDSDRGPVLYWLFIMEDEAWVQMRDDAVWRDPEKMENLPHSDTAFRMLQFAEGWHELSPTEAAALDAQRRGADSAPADLYEPVGTLPVVGDRVTITRLGNHTELYQPGRWWVGQKLTVERIDGSGDDRIVFFGDDYEPSLGICAFMRDDHNEGVYYAAGYFIRARILKRQKPASDVRPRAWRGNDGSGDIELWYEGRWRHKKDGKWVDNPVLDSLRPPHEGVVWLNPEVTDADDLGAIVADFLGKPAPDLKYKIADDTATALRRDVNQLREDVDKLKAGKDKGSL